MSRDDGFRTVIDHDPRFLHDIKVRRLRRDAPDEGEGAIRTLLYVALRDSAWSEGERLTVEEADTPYEASDERIAALLAVGLIDGEHRIPSEPWEKWFIPAWDRREKKRAGSAEGNRRRWESHSDPVTGSHSDSPRDSHSDSLGESHSDSPSVRPSDPTDRAPNARAGARGNDAAPKKNDEEKDERTRGSLDRFLREHNEVH